jgi:hypothetical protein
LVSLKEQPRPLLFTTHNDFHSWRLSNIGLGLQFEMAGERRVATAIEAPNGSFWVLAKRVFVVNDQAGAMKSSRLSIGDPDI